jgi:AcrR family transcriptional regulator
MPVEYPKRTLKKNLNREKLVVAAALLFSRNGHMRTTLNDVASYAGVHVQTLYKHFKTKEELAIASAEIVVTDCRKKFEEKFETHCSFAIWRDWIESTVLYLTDLGIGIYKQEQIRSASSLLNDNYLLVVYSGYEDILTEYLAKDFGMDPKTDRLPRLVACMLWSGNEAAMKRCAGLDCANTDLDFDEAILGESLHVVDEVEKIFSTYIKSPRPQNTD